MLQPKKSSSNWLDTAIVPSKVKYGTPEYEKAYNEGQVQSKDFDPNSFDPTWWGGVLPEVVIKRKNKDKNWLEQYRDKIVNENKDAGVLGAIIGTPISAITSLPQLMGMKALTGKMERPSEGLGISNPYGAFAIDAIADPANLIGAGILTKEETLAKLGKTSVSTELKEGLHSNGFLDMFKTKKPLEKVSEFNSEIDWSKWNKEIPDNPHLMKEYDAIEQTSKAKGSWMKNPDGSVFQGTPEQFVQQNSSNFKKAFPEGSENVFRGTGENIAELRPNRSTFTANQELASGYAPFNKKSNFLNSESVEGGVHSFYRKNSKNSLELDANNTSWTSVDLSNRRLTKDYFERNIKSQEDHITKQKEYLSKMKQNPNGSWEAPDGTTYSNDLYKNTVAERELYLKDLKERYKNIDNLISNPKELEEMKKVLGNTTTTDDIAAYVEKRNLDYVKLKNIEDSGVGDVTIINHKPGNYLKSAIGNNGMFDMTNPNIYKALIPGAIGLGVLQEKQKSNNWLDNLQ